MKVKEMLGGSRELGTSGWMDVAQGSIDQFADATGDHQWIHVDPERASEGPFGSTVAHGFMVMSLVPMALEELLGFEDQTMGLNYGVNRLRFTSPVKSGSRVRARCTILGAETRGEGVLATLNVEVEIEGESKPALVGEFLLLAFD